MTDIEPTDKHDVVKNGGEDLPEMDSDGILASIDSEVSRADPSMEEFEAALTTVVSDIEDTLGQDEVERDRVAEAIVAGCVGRETEFGRRMRKLEDRRAPYLAEEAARMKYDDPDWISDMTPAVFDEDREGENDET